MPCRHTISAMQELAKVAVGGVGLYSCKRGKPNVAAMVSRGAWAAVRTRRGCELDGEPCHLGEVLSGRSSPLLDIPTHGTGLHVPRQVPKVSRGIVSTLGVVGTAAKHLAPYDVFYFGVPSHREYVVMLAQRDDLFAWSIFRRRISKKVGLYRTDDHKMMYLQDSIEWYRFEPGLVRVLTLGGPLTPWFKDSRHASLHVGSDSVVCRAGANVAWSNAWREHVDTSLFSAPRFAAVAEFDRIELERFACKRSLQVRICRAGLSVDGVDVPANVYRQRYDRRLGAPPDVACYVSTLDFCNALSGLRLRGYTTFSVAIDLEGRGAWVTSTTGSGARLPLVYS